MRSISLSVVVGVISLALLGTAPSAAHAQRVRVAPAAVPMPVNIRTGATHTVTLGVVPSATVLPVTRFPFNPRTGTFSAVPVTTTARIPTNAFLNAGRLMSLEADFHVNPYALAAVNRSYSALLSSSPYSNPYLYSSPYYSPYMMAYGGYGGSYGGGYAGGYGGSYGGGYGSSYMNAAMTNPYMGYANSAASTTPVYNTATVPAALNPIAEGGIYDNRYEPKTITVAPGTTVRWTNYGNNKHSVTSDSGLWDSQGLAVGATTSYTFTQVGTYTYHCTLHPDMHGTVIVK